MKIEIKILIVMLIAVASSHAMLTVYEGFDYTQTQLTGNTGANGSGCNGGDGFALGSEWLSIPDPGFGWEDPEPALLEDSGMTFPSNVTHSVIGKNWKILKTDNPGGRGYAGRALATPINFAVESTWYLSFLMKSKPENGDGYFFLTIGQESGQESAIMTGIAGSGGIQLRRDFADKYYLGPANDSTKLNFMVVKIITHASMNDEYFLKNYVVGDDLVDAIEPSTWSSSHTAASSLNCDGIGMMAGGLDGWLATGGILTYSYLDEIRIGTTWNDVVGRMNPTLDFPNPGPQITTNTVVLGASSDSSEPVDYSVTSGLADEDAGTVTFTGAGSVGIEATQAGNEHYFPATNSVTFDVTKAVAVVTFSDLLQAYDGQPHGATVATEPVGLIYSATYDGSSSEPSAVGQYAVVATINDAMYSGSASDQFELIETHANMVMNADQTVAFNVKSPLHPILQTTTNLVNPDWVDIPTEGVARPVILSTTTNGSLYQLNVDLGPYTTRYIRARY